MDISDPSLLGKKSVTKRDILSLVGLLQHATKVIRYGGAFVAWMYATAAKVNYLSTRHPRISVDISGNAQMPVLQLVCYTSSTPKICPNLLLTALPII